MWGAATEDPKNFEFFSKMMNQNFFYCIYTRCAIWGAAAVIGSPPKITEFGDFLDQTVFQCVYTRCDCGDARRGCERVSGDCGGEKNRIFTREPCDEPPLIFVYRSGGGVRR